MTSEYTRLFNRINEYLEKEDVETTSDTISAYTLFTMVDNRLSKLRDKLIDNSPLKEKINKSRFNLIKLAKKFRQEKGYIYNCTPFNMQCKHIEGKKSDKGIEMQLYFYNERCLADYYKIGIKKENDSDDIYFDRNSDIIDKEFIQRNREEITETFTIIEEFSELFQSSVNKFINHKKTLFFSDGFFETKLTRMDNGYCVIHLSATDDWKEIFKREWVDHESLISFVKKNKAEILKKIPIQISSLDYTCRTIVDEALYQQMLPQPKQKTLGKR